jgi:hypothetical protein
MAPLRLADFVAAISYLLMPEEMHTTAAKYKVLLPGLYHRQGFKH